MSSDNDSDGGETTLGSPPEPLSPCFWEGGGVKRRAGAVDPVAVEAVNALGRLREEESERLGDWKLAQLSDICYSMETAMMSPPIACTANDDAIDRTGKDNADTAPAASKPTARKTLLLSPASQLDVLSQISELAERNRRESAPVQAMPTQNQSSTAGNTSRPHIWATAQHRRKKRAPPSAAGDDASDDDACGSFVTQVTGSSKKRKTHVPHHSDKLEADMLDWETCSEDLFLSNDDALDDAWEFEDVSDSDFE